MSISQELPCGRAMTFHADALHHREPPIITVYDLFEEVRRLIIRAQGGGLDQTVVCPLHEAGEKIMQHIPHSPAPTAGGAVNDRRGGLRLLPHDQGHICQGERRFQVKLLDLGTHGFGIFSPFAMADGDVLLLEVLGADGMTDTFSCSVAFCRGKGQGYRVGLTLLARLPRT